MAKAIVANPNSTIYNYDPIPNLEGFIPAGEQLSLKPTETFLHANLVMPAGQTVNTILRTGQVIFDTNGDGTITGENLPTVGGGNDLFITTIEEGINVAVATPQHVRVLSSTGAVIYSGMIQTALDIPLPCVGVYVVSGENEVQKVLY